MKSKVQARKMVLASLFVVAIVSLYRDRKGSSAAGQQGTFRVLWGVGVVGMFLSLLADFVPTVAGPFAGLVALGSLTHGGDAAIAKILGTITPKTGGGSSSSTPPGPSGSSSGPPGLQGPIASTSSPAATPTK